MDVEHAATIPIANSSSGIDRMMSVVRDTSVSSQPPKKPASTPSTTPMNTEMAVATTPTISDTRMP